VITFVTGMETTSPGAYAASRSYSCPGMPRLPMQRGPVSVFPRKLNGNLPRAEGCQIPNIPGAMKSPCRREPIIVLRALAARYRLERTHRTHTGCLTSLVMSGSSAWTHGFLIRTGPCVNRKRICGACGWQRLNGEPSGAGVSMPLHSICASRHEIVTGLTIQLPTSDSAVPKARLLVVF